MFCWIRFKYIFRVKCSVGAKGEKDQIRIKLLLYSRLQQTRKIRRFLQSQMLCRNRRFKDNFRLKCFAPMEGENDLIKITFDSNYLYVVGSIKKEDFYNAKPSAEIQDVKISLEWNALLVWKVERNWIGRIVCLALTDDTPLMHWVEFSIDIGGNEEIFYRFKCLLACKKSFLQSRFFYWLWEWRDFFFRI